MGQIQPNIDSSAIGSSAPKAIILWPPDVYPSVGRALNLVGSVW
jgi:hypothetical protein